MAEPPWLVSTSLQSGIDGEQLRLLRQEVSRPVLDQLQTCLLKIRDELLLKSEPGQAVAYVRKNWVALTRYLDDGHLSIDNNHTERSLRGIALGRHNWTFLGSDRGGKTMAVLRSFVASCELVGVDPTCGSEMCFRALLIIPSNNSTYSYRIAGQRLAPNSVLLASPSHSGLVFM